MLPGKRRENCCAREVAEARCPPPVSEDKKRIFKAFGWFWGVCNGRWEIVCDVGPRDSLGCSSCAGSVSRVCSREGSSCDDVDVMRSGEDLPRL